MSARPSMVPSEVPTYRQGVKTLSPFLAKVSAKWNEVMASRASLSMLVTLEERERLKELSRWSSGLAPRGGHTDKRTVGRRQREVKHPHSSATSRQMKDAAVDTRNDSSDKLGVNIPKLAKAVEDTQLGVDLLGRWGHVVKRSSFRGQSTI